MKDRSESGYIGGVPEEILEQEGSDEVSGKLSQRTLAYENTERSIVIEDKEDRNFRFKIDVDEEGFIHLDIYTKDNQNNKHPDLFAKQLIAKSLEVFQARGIEMRGLVGSWFLTTKFSGDNGQEYLENLKKGMSEVEAAKNTWTGRLAQELGFSQVESVETSLAINGAPYHIEARFV